MPKTIPEPLITHFYDNLQKLSHCFVGLFLNCCLCQEYNTLYNLLSFINIATKQWATLIQCICYEVAAKNIDLKERCFVLPLLTSIYCRKLNLCYLWRFSFILIMNNIYFRDLILCTKLNLSQNRLQKETIK